MQITQILHKRYAAKMYDPSRPLSQSIIQTLLQTLRFSPSSINSQPWHFLIANTPEAKSTLTQATQDEFSFNASKIRDAGLVIVLCARNELSENYLDQILAQENADGRFADDQARLAARAMRINYVKQCQDAGQLTAWLQKQTYIALGMLLMSAAMLEIDATPIEGFDASKLDQMLSLPQRQLSSQVVVALGYHSEDDKNAKLPKSRLPDQQLFSYL